MNFGEWRLISSSDCIVLVLVLISSDLYVWRKISSFWKRPSRIQWTRHAGADLLYGCNYMYIKINYMGMSIPIVSHKGALNL